MDEKQIIQQIIDLKEDEVEEYIEQRLIELENTAVEDRDVISSVSYILRRAKGEKENTEVVGYIPSKTKLQKMQYDIAMFKLDDKSFYRTVIDYIKEIDSKKIKQGDKINHNYIMNIIQCTLINYFGIKGNESRRIALYNSKDDVENDDNILSIKDFKGNNTAMCLERSAVAQNILAFLGYNPMMVMGFLSNKKGIVNEGHAFNCIIRNEKGMLVDFTNPICKDGEYCGVAQYPIKKEKLQEFMKGKGQIEVQYKNLYTENGEVKEEIIPAVYSSEEIDPRYFEKYLKENKNVSPQSINQDTQNIGLREINTVEQKTIQLQNQRTIQDREVSE